MVKLDSRKMRSLLLAMLLAPMFCMGQASVVVDKLSVWIQPDDAMKVVCIVQNVDSVAATNFVVRLNALDDKGRTVKKRELVLFRLSRLQPQQKAMFTELIEDCARCETVRVLVETNNLTRVMP